MTERSFETEDLYPKPVDMQTVIIEGLTGSLNVWDKSFDHESLFDTLKIFDQSVTKKREVDESHMSEGSPVVLKDLTIEVT